MAEMKLTFRFSDDSIEQASIWAEEVAKTASKLKNLMDNPPVFVMDATGEDSTE